MARDDAKRLAGGEGDAALQERLWPSAEQRLLLQAALANGEKARAAYLAWRSGIDLEADFAWSALRLLPLVYHNLKSAGHDDRFMGRLKGVHRRAWYETHQLFHHVSPMVRALTERGVNVVALKGAALQLDYYEQCGLRPMSDVDLWIPEASLPLAIDLLKEGGWRFGVYPNPDHVRFHHAVQCYGPDGGELDLHWHVFWERPRPGFEAMIMSRLEKLDFAGIPIRQLDPTTLLLHVVTHGVRWNVETPIRWIPDSLMILRRRGNDIDWDRLISLAREARASYRLRLGLTYLVEHFGAAIPEHVLGTLRATRVTLLERIDRSFVLRDEADFERSALHQQWAHFADFCRRSDATNPVSFAVGYTHYLRYRWRLDGRREIPGMIWRGIRKRIMPAPDHPSASAP